MKIGIKEFRDRLREVTDIGEPVMVTNHGRVVATYLPHQRPSLAEARRAAAEVKAWQEEARAAGIDLDAMLADMDMDPWGVPLDEAGR